MVVDVYYLASQFLYCINSQSRIPRTVYLIPTNYIANTVRMSKNVRRLYRKKCCIGLRSICKDKVSAYAFKMNLPPAVEGSGRRRGRWTVYTAEVPVPGLDAAEPAELFQRLDADGDGAVLRNEVEENQLGLFERLLRTSDVNGDGRLNRDEFVVGTTNPPVTTTAAGAGASFGNRPGPADIFRRFDNDADGILMLEEVPERMKNRFHQVDADGNGEVTEGEFTEQFERHMQEFRARQSANQSNRK